MQNSKWYEILKKNLTPASHARNTTEPSYEVTLVRSYTPVLPWKDGSLNKSPVDKILQELKMLSTVNFKLKVRSSR